MNERFHLFHKNAKHITFSRMTFSSRPAKLGVNDTDIGITSALTPN